MILSLEESMADHRRDKFRPLFVCTMGGLTLLYICFGVSGYASFGPHTMDIITLNLPHGRGSIVDFAAVVKICLGVSLFFTYPMMLFPVTHLLDKTFGLHGAPHKGNLVRLVLVAMTGMVVSAVPNFAVLMSLIGATCCTLLAFILPAAFHLSIFKQRLTRRQRYFDVLLIVLGVVGSVVGLWDAFDRMSQAHDPLLALDEFSSHKNASTHHNPASPHLSLPPSHVLANISEGARKYGSSEEVPVVMDNVTAAPPTRAPAVGQSYVLPQEPSAVLRAKVSGSGAQSSLLAGEPLLGFKGSIPGAALHGSVPSSGSLPDSDPPTKAAPKTEVPQSAESGPVTASTSPSGAAPKSDVPRGTLSSVTQSASVKVPWVLADSPHPAAPSQAPPT
ncbi:Amino acid transporter AVT3C [Chionoecetes opilio]|uniref:Amino acid transporter AVT3C n=1 Tax=Chionoecetes opilio TaxID=41210 RepID=A0A8J4Y9I4_CHIOP|nr:Amino acid transporter AVT3C [Chionoecetes opilio]